MATLHEDWKDVKRELGTFVGKIEGMLGEATDIEKMKDAAYQKGIKEAQKRERYEYCKDCEMKNFSDACNGYYAILYQFTNLSYVNKSIVINMIKALAEKENN